MELSLIFVRNLQKRVSKVNKKRKKELESVEESLHKND
jgi:hypothetical protein